ncbi:anti-sigma factor [Nocardioides pantholopis]|uniref:anti-sigma factor n=1 Tax=Nocardioides pantholopis TaxID=2483798 RepID=UPI000FD8F993|nr:anti-sigma factor [Nocardioides pantholopis]
MSDVHALSGAYAVDAVDDAERALFERHLAECGACRAEVESLREAAALLAETTATTPAPGLRDAVLAGIATVRPLPPATEPPVSGPPAPTAPPQPTTGPESGPDAPPPAGPVVPLRRRARRRWLPSLAAAAAVIAACGIGLGVTQPWEEDGTVQVPSAAERVRNAPDAQAWSQEFPDGSVATLIRSTSLNQAVVVTEDMADPAEGRVYELWLQHDERMVPAGLMPKGPNNVVELEGDPASADGFGITIEPAGGSPAPTTAPLTVIEFDKA